MILGSCHRFNRGRLAVAIILGAAFLLPRASANPRNPVINRLAHLLVAPIHSPNQPGVAIIRQSIPDCIQAIRVPVGPPTATLAVIEVYPQKPPQCFARTDGGSRVARWQAKVGSMARGTVLLLPGYGLSKATLVPYAAALANQGYRSLLVDLRAQGESTGHHIGYGKQEAQDLVQLLHTVTQRGMIRYPLGMLGISYGAAVALDTAAIDRRISAVVAVASFARVSSVVRRFIRMTDPELAHRISGSILRRIIEQAGKLVGYPLAESDPLRWVSDIRAHVLYLAGSEDQISPFHSIQQLASQTPCAKVDVVRGANHMELSFDTRLITQKVISWFRHDLANPPRHEPARKKRRAPSGLNSRRRSCGTVERSQARSPIDSPTDRRHSRL